MTATTVDLSTCTAQSKVTYNKDRNINKIVITVTSPNHGQIAVVKSTQIYRRLLRGIFHSELDEESEELHRFSQKLFDKNGYLKTEHIDHDFHKGTGCWGEEVNNGTIFYVEEISVKGPARTFSSFGLGPR